MRTDLETLIDRALKELPEPAAPETLLPRVLAAVAAAERRAWYARPWMEWPRVLQVASAASVVVVLALAAWFVPVDGLIGGVMVRNPMLERAATFVADLHLMQRVAAVLARTLLAPIAIYLSVLVAMTAVLSAVVVQTFRRAAFGGVRV
jgi:hypothetical protein